jgi:hypothetical protein
MKNFSKTVIRGMILLWFAGAAFGAVVVVVQLIQSFISGSPYSQTVVNLPELLSYIGMPVSGAIVGYLAKSAFENREKIKNNPGYITGERQDIP